MAKSNQVAILRLPANPIDTTDFIDNQFTHSNANVWIDVHDPATNNLVTRVPQSTMEELQAAVESAHQAFPRWRATSIIARQQIMFRLTYLIRQNMDRIAASITLEQGKTIVDANGDVLRGKNVTSFWSSADAVATENNVAMPTHH